MTDSAAPAVSCAGVTKRYGDFVAVSDLSLAVPRGSIFGLLGPNGAGKSTTIRMMNDILSPDSGEIRLFGTLRPGREAAKRIGYLPEERGLYPKMSVGEVLRFFGELRGLSGAEAIARANKWLDRLKLGDWATHKVQDLSKGMQQKVQFITAVIHDPDLLILDEPWSGLDPINADVLLEIVQEQKRAGKTILFSTHLMEQAEKVCDEVCIISRSRKILEGTVAAVKREATKDRTIALSTAGEADDARAAAILADTTLVATRRAGTANAHQEVDLAAGATSQALLERLVGAGVGLRKFELLEPTLHQIFVDRVNAEEARRA